MDRKMSEREVARFKQLASVLKESHPGNDQWYEEFQAAISAMGLAGEAEVRVMKALDHTDPISQYGTMPAAQAAKEFVEDLGIVDANDYDDYDDSFPTDYGDPGADYNDGEFWEGEAKRLQEMAGLASEDADYESESGDTNVMGDTSAMGIDEAGNVKGIRIEIPGNSHAGDFGKAAAREVVESFGPREYRNFLEAFLNEFKKITGGV